MKKADDLNYQRPLLFLDKKAKEEWLERELEIIYGDKNSFEELYEGEIVQCTIEGQLARFYPDEYKIMDKERLFEIMQEEGYHTIIQKELKNVKEFYDKVHYLQSRGVNKSVADKWASLSYGPMVMYKPYYQLLEYFCRENEIYKDKFYEEVEGVIFE